MIDLLGGRKATACLVALLIAVGAFILKGDIPEGLSDMIKYIVTTYIAGNVGSDAVAAITAKRAEPVPPVQEAVVNLPTAIDHSEQLSRIEKSVQQVGGSVNACTNGLSHVLAIISPQRS